MNKLIILFCCLAIATCACGSSPTHEKLLSEVKVINMGFSALTFMFVDVKDLLSYSENTVDIISVKDKDTLKRIFAKLNKKIEHNTTPDLYPDIRMVCLLKYQNTTEIDTLSFGIGPALPPALMVYNSKLYVLDEELLKIIADQLPDNNKEAIYGYLNGYLSRLKKINKE